MVLKVKVVVEIRLMLRLRLSFRLRMSMRKDDGYGRWTMDAGC